AGMLHSSVQGCIYSGSREESPRWWPVAWHQFDTGRILVGDIHHDYVINAGFQKNEGMRG
ncbi:MAG: hypothetical protein ACPHQ9_16515, partial [Marinobacter sp.]|uniref:hypothetical protein n=1 Tax=Marinobacter sp. TaxID=50741 RepID=UPI003C50DA87